MGCKPDSEQQWYCSLMTESINKYILPRKMDGRKLKITSVWKPEKSSGIWTKPSSIWIQNVSFLDLYIQMIIGWASGSFKIPNHVPQQFWTRTDITLQKSSWGLWISKPYPRMNLPEPYIPQLASLSHLAHLERELMHASITKTWGHVRWIDWKYGPKREYNETGGGCSMARLVKVEQQQQQQQNPHDSTHSPRLHLQNSPVWHCFQKVSPRKQFSPTWTCSWSKTRILLMVPRNYFLSIWPSSFPIQRRWEGIWLYFHLI